MWYVTFRVGGAIDVTEAGTTMEYNRKAACDWFGRDQEREHKVQGLLILDEAESLDVARISAREWKRRLRLPVYANDQTKAPQ